MRNLLGAGGAPGVISLWTLFLPHMVGSTTSFSVHSCTSVIPFSSERYISSTYLRPFPPQYRAILCWLTIACPSPFSPLPLSIAPIDSVQELIDTAPGDVECPTCSEPLTVDLSGGSPSANDEDEEQDNETGRGRGRKRKGSSRGGGGRSGSHGRGGAARGGGVGGSRGNTGATGRMASMVATLAASVKNKKHASSTGFKSSVTKHSVINRVDLSKFQSVSWRFT